jgi:hypothetical protein
VPWAKPWRAGEGHGRQRGFALPLHHREWLAGAYVTALAPAKDETPADEKEFRARVWLGVASTPYSLAEGQAETAKISQLSARMLREYEP